MDYERPGLADFYLKYDLSRYRKMVLSYLLVATSAEYDQGSDLLSQVSDLLTQEDATRGDLLFVSAALVGYFLQLDKQTEETMTTGKFKEISWRRLRDLMEGE